MSSEWPYASAIAEALYQAAGEGPETAGAPATPLETVKGRIAAELCARFNRARLGSMPRRELAREISALVAAELDRHAIALNLLEQRELVSGLLVDILERPRGPAPGPANDGADPLSLVPGAPAPPAADALGEVKARVQPILLERIDMGVASRLPYSELAHQIGDLVTDILGEHKIQLNRREQRDLVGMLLNDMLGLGPLEPLLADEGVTDILVNGAKQVYVERGGKLELTGISFRDDKHVMHIAQRIVTRIGRRIDESTPLVDARLEDGSRVNIIVPPLAIDGPSISIRKFSKKSITLDIMARQGNISEPLATLLKVVARARLNVLISGGTGSGKTTLLNALSQMIDHGERIVTIEDAAELQLQQPHVVRLETRPANLEGAGEIAQRDLVKNALRMRPDRIILGEVRGPEALDMLQAMNTGHDGSMCTVHANNPREALTRLENMVAMSGFKLPAEAVRGQIVAAINVIVQIARMRDGVRRVIKVSEIVGMEGEVITMQDLFEFERRGPGGSGRVEGRFASSGLKPHFTPKADYYGLGTMLSEAMACPASSPQAR